MRLTPCEGEFVKVSQNLIVQARAQLGGGLGLILMMILMVIRKASIFKKDFELNYGWVGIKSLLLFYSNVYICNIFGPF